MSKRDEKKKMKVNDCTSSTSNDMSDCGNRNTKACGSGRKCK